jgi:hypothetical protein
MLPKPFKQMLHFGVAEWIIIGRQDAAQFLERITNPQVSSLAFGQ